MTNTGKLAAKMVGAMKAIDAVEKNGKNTFQNYKYVRAADVANEVRKAMIANGIAFTFDVVDSQHWTGGKEDKMFFCQLTVNCTFTCSESGETMSGRVVGWGSDTLDKAPFKAMTGAIKYALRMNFLIPDESDPENDANDQRLAAAKARTSAVAEEPTATEAQMKKLWSRCEEYKLTKDQIKAALATEGVTDLKHMPLKAYDSIWVWIAEAA